MKEISFVVVDCGHIGKWYCSMLLNNQNCELVALCDNRTIAETKAENFNITYSPNDYDVYKGFATNHHFLST